MEFVIVRPGGLKSEPGTGKGVLTEDASGEAGRCGCLHLLCKSARVGISADRAGPLVGAGHWQKGAHHGCLG